MSSSCLSAFVLCSCLVAFAQGPAVSRLSATAAGPHSDSGASAPAVCASGIPVLAFVPDGRQLLKLSQESFLASDKKHALPIAGFSIDESPRHLLIIAAAGSHMPKYTAEVESTLISAILGQSRPQDSFALLTSGGRADEVGFGSNSQQFQTVLSTLGENAKQKGSSSLDTLDYALRHFGELQDGDAVLLLSMGFEAESNRTNYGKVQRELEQRQIRVFGFQLGTEIVGYYSTEITNVGGRLGVSTSSFPNETTLFNMAWESGGYMIQENTEGAPWKQYKFNDEHRQRLEINARRAYQAMFHFYRLRLGGGSKNLSLNLSPELQNRYPTARLSYPQLPTQCLK